MPNTIDSYLAVHENALKQRSQRTAILASNIANSDTPNYKARDLAFSEVLRDVQPGLRRVVAPRTKGSGMYMTHGKHLQGSTRSTSAQMLYRQPAEASLDGNTVDKDQEQARFAENTVRYQASLRFMNSRISGLIRAIRGE